MNARRKLLLWLLVPLGGVLFLSQGFGQVEVTLWLVLVVSWFFAFFRWARRDATQQTR